MQPDQANQLSSHKTTQPNLETDLVEILFGAPFLTVVLVITVIVFMPILLSAP